MIGITQESYSKYRIGGDLTEVEDGINNLILWKKKLKRKQPYIILQFLVLSSNEHQIREARRKAKEWGVQIVFKSPQIMHMDKNEFLIPKNKKYSRYQVSTEGRISIKSKLPNRCFRMWSGAVITWDGKVLPCCFDKDADHELGNLKNDSLQNIWNEKHNIFRKKILTSRKDIEMCRNCTEGLK